MSEAENPPMTTSEDLNGGVVINTDPVDTPAPQPTPAPQATVPNPGPISPTEAALIEQFSLLEARVKVLEEQHEDMSDAWGHFAEGADRILKLCQAGTSEELHKLMTAIHDRVTRIEARFL